MLKNTIVSFLKIGAIGFGGGSALIPVVEEEIVKKKGYISKDTYTEHTIIANITPGALPVKLGALGGFQMGGLWGMVLGAFSIAMPGVLGTIVLLSLLSLVGEHALEQIEFASVGISVFIIFLLLEYIHKILHDAQKQSFHKHAIGIMSFSFIVTCGKELRGLLTLFLGESALWSSKSLLDLSTISLLGLAFFVIFFTCGRITGKRGIFAGCVIIFYLLTFGKSPVLTHNFWVLGLQLSMVVCAIFMVIYDVKQETAATSAVIKPDIGLLSKKILLFAGIMLFCFLPALLLVGDISMYASQGAISTATSFGGGEAYLTVADGIFVGSGQLTSAEFYGQIVPVANALPGPILVKILAGIGYMLGFSTGGILGGYALALLGFSLAVGTTCIICMIVETVYQSFSGLQVFLVLKNWVLPVICGLLLSTVLSMVIEILKVSEKSGFSPTLGGAFMAILFGITYYVCKKRHFTDLMAILLMGGLSVLTFNLF